MLWFIQKKVLPTDTCLDDSSFSQSRKDSLNQEGNEIVYYSFTQEAETLHSVLFLESDKNMKLWVIWEKEI